MQTFAGFHLIKVSAYVGFNTISAVCEANDLKLYVHSSDLHSLDDFQPSDLSFLIWAADNPTILL